MPTWTSISTSAAGALISPSTIDRILDNIAVLSIHSHSGSAGDGSANLSGAVFSNEGVIFPHDNNFVLYPIMLPASQVNWYHLTIASRNGAWMYTDRVLLTSCTLNACAAWVIRYTGSFTNHRITTHWQLSPSAGCITMLVDGASVQNVDTYFSSISDFVTNANVDTGQVSGSSILKFTVSGSNPSSSGYGACCLAIVVRPF